MLLGSISQGYGMQNIEWRHTINLQQLLVTIITPKTKANFLNGEVPQI